MLVRSVALVAAGLAVSGFTGAVRPLAATATPSTVAAPTVTGLAPNRASAADRPLVAIAGTGFTAASTVTFGAEPATSVAVQSTGLIYARPPSGLSGTVDVRVTAHAQPSPVSTNDQYTVVAPPPAPAFDTDLGFGTTDVACAPDGYCLITGDRGRAVAFTGDRRGPVRSTPDIYDASCTSASFCAGYGAQDHAYVFDGQHWSTSAALPTLYPGLVAISCTGATCLIASTNGTWWRFHAGTWTSGTGGPGPVSDAESMDLSCAAAGFCVAAVGRNDHAEILQSRLYRFNGSSWSMPTVFRSYPDRPTRVSCASATYCFAETYGGDRLWNGARWTTLTTSPAERMRYLRCFAADACLAEGLPTRGSHHDRLLRFDGTAWTDLGIVPNAGVRVGPPYVDCSSMTICRSVTALDYTRRWRASSGFGPAREISDRLYGASMVSCAGQSYCVAVSRSGRMGLWDGVWHRSVPIDRAASPTAVSCTAGDRCVVVDDAGYAITVTRDGATLSRRHIDTAALNGVSCGSNSFCVATDAAGRVVRLEGGSWHPPTRHGPAGALRAVSCTAAPNFCLAVGHGYATHYRGNGRWTPAELIAPYTRAVACTSAKYCLIGLKAGVRFWGGRALSPKYTFAHAADIFAASCPVDEYCVVASNAQREPTDSAYIALDGAVHSPTPLPGVVDEIVGCSAPGRCLILRGGDRVEATQ